MRPISIRDQQDRIGSIVVIEDHPLYRDALVFMLQGILGGSRVVAAGTVEEATSSVPHKANVRLVLLDIGLPGLNGTDAVLAMRDACPKATLVVVSASEDRRDAVAAFRAGAQLFISKSASTDVFTGVVRSIMAGELPEQPEWIGAGEQGALIGESLPSLTSRQHQILSLLSNGHSNKEIGLRLALSEATVKMHVSCIFRLLNVANRTQAVLIARRLGLREEMMT